MAKKSGQVKTYRVLHEGMKVGNSVRHVGDLMPEASGFANLKSYLNADWLEEIYVDQSELDEFVAGLEKESKKASKPAGTEDDSGESKPKKTKKRVAKKTVAKKTVKGKSSGRKLAEQSV